MNQHLTAVAPTRPIAPWLGGKRNLAKRICAIIDADTNHRSYAEPFVGMGGIFLRRTGAANARSQPEADPTLATNLPIEHIHIGRKD
jgi:DNA adenine methylase